MINKLNRQSVNYLKSVLPESEASRLIEGAVNANKIETKYEGLMVRFFDRIDKKLENAILKNKKIEDVFSEKTFQTLVFAMMFEMAREAIESQKDPEKKPPKESRLASPPKIKSDLASLMEAWDNYRKKGVVPKRFEKITRDVKKDYLNKVKKEVRKRKPLLETGQADLERIAIAEIKEAGRSTLARAQMIVRTESTNYYNDVRKELFDENDDITHYLFIAIRDQATTKWCKTRDKLVYKKDSEYLKKEKPACHWNCRSEIVPLTRANPAHKRIIENKSKWRENNSPEPLPKGWGE